MASKKTFDIHRKPLEEPDELHDVLEEIHASPRGKRRHGDTLLTVGIVVVAFIIAIKISNVYATRIQATQRSTQKDTTQTPPPPQETKTEQKESSADPFAPFTLKDAKEVAPTPVIPAPTAPTKNSFTIKILNGNGVTGDAAKLKKELSDKGFSTGDTGNAKLKYIKTQVYYKAGKKAQADLVVQNLTGKITEQSEADAGLIGDGNDVLIVIGKS